MKISTHYDSTGTIHALITSNAPDGFSLMLVPEPAYSSPRSRA